MTTKEIAEIAGVSVQTVRRIAETKVGYVFEAGKKAGFTEKESIEIMRELKKKGFIQPVQNGQVPVQNGAVPRQNADVLPKNAEVAHLGVMVANLCMAVSEQMKMISAQNDKINSFIGQKQERIALPAPQIDPRTHIIKLVDEYTARTGTPHRDAYTMLYRDYGYRTHCNAILSAKNRGMKIIDYIDSEGQIETLEAIALEVMQ